MTEKPHPASAPTDDRTKLRKVPELIYPGFRNSLNGYRGAHSPVGGAYASDHAMPLFFFRIRNGRYSGASDHGTELADRDAAWHELTKFCSNIVTGISRKLKPDSEWEMELLDQSRQPVFRIRLVTESLNRFPAK